MKSLTFSLTISSLLAVALASPAPLRPRATTSAAVAAFTPGSTGPSTAAIEAAIAGCSNANLAGETENDIVNGVCKGFTLLFARGTLEDGNIGGIVGPPFVAALTAKLGAANVAVQGVNNYAADIPGFLAGGSATGSANMASLIEQTMTQCPNTKLCVSGYSQGAQVAHNAANLISSAATAFINSVVLFGDPDDGEAFGQVPASKVSTDCHVGDDICLHGDLILVQHLDYCLDVGTEASFAAAKSGL